MNTFRRFSLFSLPLLLWTVLPTSLFAEQLPTQAKQNLRAILLTEEFQPRTQRLDPLEQLWKKIWPPIAAQLNEIWSGLTGNLDSIQSHLPDWLFGFSNSATALLSWGAILMLLFYAYLLLRQFFLPAIIRLKKHLLNAKSKDNSIDIAQLAQTQEHRLLIEQLRRLLRDKLGTKYFTSESTTDREIIRRTKPNKTEDALFGDVAMVFEQVAFANNPPNHSELERIRKTAAESLEEIT